MDSRYAYQYQHNLPQPPPPQQHQHQQPYSQQQQHNNSSQQLFTPQPQPHQQQQHNSPSQQPFPPSSTPNPHSQSHDPSALKKPTKPHKEKGKKKDKKKITPPTPTPHPDKPTCTVGFFQAEGCKFKHAYPFLDGVPLFYLDPRAGRPCTDEKPCPLHAAVNAEWVTYLEAYRTKIPDEDFRQVRRPPPNSWVRWKCSRMGKDYEHHGFHVKNGLVVEVDQGGVAWRILTPDRNHWVRVGTFPEVSPEWLVYCVAVGRAHFEGKGAYALLERNCEHFVTFLTKGVWSSRQVNRNPITSVVVSLFGLRGGDPSLWPQPACIRVEEDYEFRHKHL